MDFATWLEKEKGFSHKGSRDAESRIKRVKGLLKDSSITQETITELEKISDFTNLSISVKSQLRRSVKLYLEFSEKN